MAIMLAGEIVAFAIIFECLPPATCVDRLHVKTKHNNDNKHIRNFTKDWFGSWETPVIHVVLSQLTNFDGSVWLTTVANLMNYVKVLPNSKANFRNIEVLKSNRAAEFEMDYGKHPFWIEFLLGPPWNYRRKYLSFHFSS